MSNRMGRSLLAVILFAAALTVSVSGIVPSRLFPTQIPVLAVEYPQYESPLLLSQLSGTPAKAIDDRDGEPYDRSHRLDLFPDQSFTWSDTFKTIKLNDLQRELAHAAGLPVFPILRVFNQRMTELAAPRPLAVFRPATRSPPV